MIAEADGKPMAREGFGAGRMGHGLGLRMCEPPSNSPDDETVLEENMVLTIEPGIPFTVEGATDPNEGSWCTRKTWWSGRTAGSC